MGDKIKINIWKRFKILYIENPEIILTPIIFIDKDQLIEHSRRPADMEIKVGERAKGAGIGKVVFDRGDNAGNFSSFTRLILKKKYLYGDDVRLYRGKIITCQSVKGRKLYLDGELISVPNESLEVRIGEKQLTVFG